MNETTNYIPIKPREKILIGKIYGIPFQAKELEIKKKSVNENAGEIRLTVGIDIYFEEATGNTEEKAESF